MSKPNPDALVIRAEESNARAARPRIDNYKNKQVLHKPIFLWAEWHVWEFIDRFKLPYPMLYDEGFDRIGCVICPFIMRKSQVALNRSRERWPAMYRAFERVVTGWYLNHSTKKHRYSEETVEEYIAALYQGFEGSAHDPQSPGNSARASGLRLTMLIDKFVHPERF